MSGRDSHTAGAITIFSLAITSSALENKIIAAYSVAIMNRDTRFICYALLHCLKIAVNSSVFNAYNEYQQALYIMALSVIFRV